MKDSERSEKEGTSTLLGDDMNHDFSDNTTQDEVHELSSDMEVVGPGQMLSEARIQMGFSQQDIATRLNFHLSLVKNIENDIFDKKVPETYNRGYLRNFAKVVNISEEDVLASYDILGVAEKQGAEMQSFSQNTKKQAEHSRLMWISYLMVIILIGSTVYWFFNDNISIQEQSKQVNNVDISTEVKPSFSSQPSKNAQIEQKEQGEVKKADATLEQASTLDSDVVHNTTVSAVTSNSTSLQQQATIRTNNEVTEGFTATELNSSAINTTASKTEESGNDLSLNNTIINKTIVNNNTTSVLSELDNNSQNDNEPQAVQFIFSGDCWVNIYDATGERVAYGVKQKGYIMNFKGFAPFKVTVARPEFVAITYQNEQVDLSAFAAGNIAKFSLPFITN